MAGYYLMSRGWQDHPVFRNEVFSRRDAFVWMIEEAAYRPIRIHAGTGEITLERGQFSHSNRYMAKAWKWEETKVRRFLSSLLAAKIIASSTAAGQTVVTICNYDKYQAPQSEPASPTAAVTPQRRRGDASKNNEVNEVMKVETGDKPLSVAPRKRSAATRLPVNWHPKALCPSTKAGQIADRRGPEWLDTTLETFTNHWRAKSGKDATKADWQATWANWVINQDRIDGRSRGNGNGRQSEQSRSGFGRTIDAAEDAIALLESHQSRTRDSA